MSLHFLEVDKIGERLKLTSDDFEKICRQAFKSSTGISALERLSNGAVNDTYRFRRGNEPYVLRCYLRDPLLCSIEQSILRLVCRDVAVPELICTGEKGAPYPWAIFRFVPGKHLDETTPDTSYALGATLAKIHQFRFPKAGLFGPDLTFKTLFKEGSSPYYQYIQEHLIEGSRAWEFLGSEVKEFTEKHQDFFPVMENGGVLVHSDFKPVNLLWDQEKGLTVLDWEFAHSGDPLLDFAILLRHYQQFPLSLSELERGYADHGGTLPTDWVRQARITDIINLVQLLERPVFDQMLVASCQFTMHHWKSLEDEIREVCR